jgi:plasmid stabilization system protein ParE
MAPNRSFRIAHGSLAKTLLGFEIKNLRRVDALRRILPSIGDYTFRAWGQAQAARYLGELEVCCQTLSDNPALGRKNGARRSFRIQNEGGVLGSAERSHS